MPFYRWGNWCLERGYVTWAGFLSYHSERQKWNQNPVSISELPTILPWYSPRNVPQCGRLLQLLCTGVVPRLLMHPGSTSVTSVYLVFDNLPLSRHFWKFLWGGGFFVQSNTDHCYFALVISYESVTSHLNIRISELEGLYWSFGPTIEQCQNGDSLSLTCHWALCPNASRDGQLITVIGHLGQLWADNTTCSHCLCKKRPNL